MNPDSSSSNLNSTQQIKSDTGNGEAQSQSNKGSSSNTLESHSNTFVPLPSTATSSQIPTMMYPTYSQYPTNIAYNQQQAEYYAKYAAMYQQHQQQQKQQILQAYQQYYAAAIQQQLQQQQQQQQAYSMQSNFYQSQPSSSSFSSSSSSSSILTTHPSTSKTIHSESLSKSDSKSNVSSTSLAASPWNLNSSNTKNMVTQSSIPTKAPSPNPYSTQADVQQKQPKATKPAPWASLTLKKPQKSLQATSAAFSQSNEKPNHPSTAKADLDNPHLRSFIKEVLRLATESKEHRAYIRSHLMEYVKTKGKLHDWENEDPDEFVESKLKLLLNRSPELESNRAPSPSISISPSFPPQSTTSSTTSSSSFNAIQSRKLDSRLGTVLSTFLPPPYTTTSSSSSSSSSSSLSSLSSFPSRSKSPIDTTLDEEEDKKKARQARFRNQQRQFQQKQLASQVSEQDLSKYIDVHRELIPDFDSTIVVGTCQSLEKPYLRLTSAPNPANVRPLPILIQSLTHLKKKWLKDRNYTFMCDQLKSVRQDLMVQRIQTEFTVQVYEMNARIALEMNDFSEFNQCQTQLKLLYQKGLSGCRYEFLGYRILYFIYTKSRRDMKILLKSLQPHDFENPFVQYALNVREACLKGDFYEFLNLYQQPPNMCGFLVHQLLDRERCKALHILTKSHLQLRLSFIQEALAFSSWNETIQFMNEILKKAWEVSVPQPDLNILLLSTNHGEEEEEEKGKELNDLIVPCSKIRKMFELYLIAYKKVDIKGQVH